MIFYLTVPIDLKVARVGEEGEGGCSMNIIVTWREGNEWLYSWLQVNCVWGNDQQAAYIHEKFSSNESKYQQTPQQPLQKIFVLNNSLLFLLDRLETVASERMFCTH